MVKKEGTTDAANGEATEKAKRPRKPKDPSAPVVPRKKRKDAGIKHSDRKSNLGAETAAGPSAALPITSQDAQNGKSEDIPRPINSFFAPAPPQPQQAPVQAQQPVRTSGQAYDPIRSSNYDPVRENLVSSGPYTNGYASPVQQNQSRTSASPSLASILEPPSQSITSPSMAAQSFAKLQNQELTKSMPSSPMTSRTALPDTRNPAVATGEGPRQPETTLTAASPVERMATPAAAVVSETTVPSKKTSPKVPVKSTNTSSTAASPKTLKDVDIEPPPLPGSSFAKGPDDGTDTRAPTIILNIPLNGEINKYINFTALAEARYGWDALHPRLAAQRDRLARVAAAGAALEKSGSNKDSGDEMSLDLSDGEGEGDASNVEMGGMSDGKNGTDNGVKKPAKKRKTKEDEYDKEDGFVDDSEALWEEKAAASNDGFFVYAGPLVPEEKPAERSEPTRRGRGGGPGSRGGRGSRGGGRGAAASSGTTRGSMTVRKPRVTKADRARMEQEKLEREKQGLLLSKGATPSTFVTPPTATQEDTPMTTA